MPNMVPQRIGPLSRILWYPEASGTPGVDPGSPVGYVLPLAAQSGVKVTQPTVSAPVFTGSLMPFQRMYGQISAGGQLALGLELLTCPYFLKAVFGSTGYTKTNLVTGAYHDFYIPAGVTIVGSGQLQNEFLEATALFLREKYLRVGSIGMAYAASGPAPFNVGLVGSGDSATTDLAGTKTNNGYTPLNHFNGQAFVNGIQVVGMPAFAFNLSTGAAPFPVAFNSGINGSVNPSNINVSGNLDLAFASTGSGVENDLTYYNYAVNQQIIPLDCLWANLPLATMTGFWNILLPSNYFDRASMAAGGAAGLTVSQPYNMVNDATASKVAAYQHGTVLGTYNITAANNQFKYSIDGAAAVTYALTLGATRTVAQIVTELNVSGPFTAVATADALGGYLRVTSKTKGTTSSVSFVTVASDSNATLGFIPTTVISGYNSPLVIRIWSSSQTAFV